MEETETETSLHPEVELVRSYWNRKAEEGEQDSVKIDASPRTQAMRFEAFALDHDLTRATVLDVGCGVGDFWGHMQLRGGAAKYLGIDLSPAMIERARAKYPQASFASLDILEEKLEPYDYTVAFGIHNNIRMQNGWELLRRVTTRQFELCRRAAHVSLLTDRYQGFEASRQAWRAEEVLTFALTLTPFVVLKHNYLPNDFSVTLYREPLIDTCPDLLLPPK
jgi:SAM-dependent methyltransferase